MAGIISWLKVSTLLDPKRDERVQKAATEVERQLAVQRKHFQLDRVLAPLDIFREDIPLVIDQTYRSLVTRAWRDATITESEQRTLDWAASALKITSERAKTIFREAGLEAFQQCLIRTVSDGRLEPNEVDALRGIAANMGMSLGELIKTYFAKEGSGLLRGMFALIASNADLAQKEWSSLCQAVSALGLTRDNLIDSIQVQAEQLIEHTLADAKADDRLSPQEQLSLKWLLSNIVRRTEFIEYVHAQLDDLKLMESIESGHLPSIQSSKIGIRAGEIVHAESPVQFSRIKQLSSGPRTDVYDGVITLTDTRLIFTSQILGFEVNHRKVIEFFEYRNGFSVTTKVKGTGTYITFHRPELFNRMYRVAVRMANQTIVRKLNSEAPSRHIDRDIRQRVWQRYSGRCAECGATDYLEFDHIIPFAKGGASTETNVQLLCRRCNAKKSDLI